jgi:hypothetical protein
MDYAKGLKGPKDTGIGSSTFIRGKYKSINFHPKSLNNKIKE